MSRAPALLLAVAFLGCWLAAPSPGPATAGADGGREREAFAIRVGQLTVREPVLGVYVLPRQEMAISTAETLPEVDVRLHAEAGTVVRPGPGEWRGGRRRDRASTRSR